MAGSGGKAPDPAGGAGGASLGQSGSAGAAGAGAGAGGAGNPTVAATCKGPFPSVATDGARYTVKVDRASAQGQLPHFWRTFGIGHLAAFLQTESGWGATLKAHVLDGIQNLELNGIRAHGLFHDDIGIYREEGGAPVYDFSRSDQIFDFLVQNGVAPIVELGSMPAALAKNPSQVWSLWKMGISPPKDFQRWQELVFKFVEHSAGRYGADVVSKWYFEVWNEPECCGGQFWKGTIDEYFHLYDSAAAGVLAALPTARVGGPVASQPVELTMNTEIGRKFLQHVTTDNFVTPGKPGHLDVFIFHTWNFVDGSVNGYFAGLDLLNSFGLNNVGVAVTEFGPTWQFNLKDEPQETAQGAAFVAQTYSDIAQRCARENKRFPVTYAWWTLSDIFKEDTYREGDPFIGAMGLISRQNIRKPAYNAYKFLSQMGSEQIALTAPNAMGVGGMATRDSSGGVQVLIYNGQSPGKGPVDDKYYTSTQAQEIAITVSGLTADLPYDVAAYRIDDTHGNAYSTWQAQGRPAMSAMTDANWMALRDTMDSKAEPMADSQCGGTYTGRFSVSSPGVVFIKLTPTPPKSATN
jgi:xylan 1,4-beta-xylosidase